MPVRFAGFDEVREWLGPSLSGLGGAVKGVAGVGAVAAAVLGGNAAAVAKPKHDGPRGGGGDGGPGGGTGDKKPKGERDGDGIGDRGQAERTPASGDGHRTTSAQETEPERGNGGDADGGNESRQRVSQEQESRTRRDAGSDEDSSEDDDETANVDHGPTPDSAGTSDPPTDLNDFDFSDGALIAGDLDANFAVVDSEQGIVVASTGNSAAVVTPDGPVIIRDQDRVGRIGEPGGEAGRDTGGDNDTDFAS